MRKPNILWICTDQQRFDSLGCYGNAKVDTPNIDKLAEGGEYFLRIPIARVRYVLRQERPF